MPKGSLRADPDAAVERERAIQRIASMLVKTLAARGRAAMEMSAAIETVREQAERIDVYDKPAAGAGGSGKVGSEVEIHVRTFPKPTTYFNRASNMIYCVLYPDDKAEVMATKRTYKRKVPPATAAAAGTATASSASGANAAEATPGDDAAVDDAARRIDDVVRNMCAADDDEDDENEEDSDHGRMKRILPPPAKRQCTGEAAAAAVVEVEVLPPLPPPALQELELLAALPELSLERDFVQVVTGQPVPRRLLEAWESEAAACGGGADAAPEILVATAQLPNGTTRYLVKRRDKRLAWRLNEEGVLDWLTRAEIERHVRKDVLDDAVRRLDTVMRRAWHHHVRYDPVRLLDDAR